MIEPSSCPSVIMKSVPRLHLTILFCAALIGALLLGAALYRTALKHAAWQAVAPAILPASRGR
jgi:hypothetical protein